MPVLVRLIGDGEALGDRVRNDCDHTGGHNRNAAMTLQVGAAGMRALMRRVAGRRRRRMILMRGTGDAINMRLVNNALLSEAVERAMASVHKSTPDRNKHKHQRHGLSHEPPAAHVSLVRSHYRLRLR